MKFGALRLLAASGAALALTGTFALPAVSAPADAPDKGLVNLDGLENPLNNHRFMVKVEGTSAADVKAAAEELSKPLGVTGAKVSPLGDTGMMVVVLDGKLDRVGAEQLMNGLAEVDGITSVVVDKMLQGAPEPPNLQASLGLTGAAAPMAAKPATPNDEHYDKQWHYDEEPGGIYLSAARGEVGDADGPLVGVIDSGITAHPDLDANIVGGYDLISDPELSRDGDGIDADPQDEGTYGSAAECGTTEDVTSSWHGTHVAGTVAAVTDNGTGVAGVAGNAKVVPVRALGKCGAGYTSDWVNGMLWAAGADVTDPSTEEPVPANENPVQVVNLSLGGSSPRPCDTDGVQSAIDKLVGMGVSVVAAAGNESSEVYSPLGNCENVIVIGASNRAADSASYTNYGAEVDVSAPGGDLNPDDDTDPSHLVVSTVNDGETTPGEPAYGYMAGTSMASPHAAGVAALMLSVNPDLTPAEVEEILKDTARPWSNNSGSAAAAMSADKPASAGECAPGADMCGTGIINAYAAVLKAKDMDTPEPTPTPTPTETPDPTPTETPDPTPTETPDPTPTQTPDPTPTQTPDPTPTETPDPTPTQTPDPTPTQTPDPTPTETPVPSPTETPVPSPTKTEDPAPTSTPTVDPNKVVYFGYEDCSETSGRKYTPGETYTWTACNEEGKPVANAEIKIYVTADGNINNLHMGELVATVTTDENGHFEMTIPESGYIGAIAEDGAPRVIVGRAPHEGDPQPGKPGLPDTGR